VGHHKDELDAGPDHPVALECPETRYLKLAVLPVR
jgi:hypothetical protein